MKKSLKIALTALLLSAAAALIVWGSGIILAAVKSVPVVPPQTAATVPQDKIFPGGDAGISFDLTLPENLLPGNVEIVCGKGSVLTGPPRWERLKWRWDRSVWRFSAGIRALTLGEIPEGKIEFFLTTVTGKNRPEKYTVAIPAFSSSIPAGEKAGSDLLLAGAMNPPARRFSALFEHARHYKYWYIAGFLLLAAVICFLWRLLHRKIQTPPQPCWEAALAALSALESRLRRGEILPVAGFTALMDILRDYLEIRFDLPASRRTTAEFLMELARNDSPLPERLQIQLSRFFAGADLIRFAKAPAGKEQFFEAAGQLADLIRNTIPENPENNPEP